MNERVKEQKKAARERVKLLLAEFRADPGRARMAADLAAAHLFSFGIYRDSALILLFLSLNTEIDTAPIIAKAFSDGKSVAAPRITEPDEYGVRGMEFHILTPDSPIEAQTEGGVLGIREPAAEGAVIRAESLPPNTLVLTPGLAFAPDGRRLGKGGGYYDRFLAQAANRAIAAGICFAAQVLPDIPEEQHDFRVSYIITEQGILSCN